MRLFHALASNIMVASIKLPPSQRDTSPQVRAEPNISLSPARQVRLSCKWRPIGVAALSQKLASPEGIEDFSIREGHSCAIPPRM
jgi:hypothetical protein